ncbi:hypothetical protein BO71DRAFT_401164 [Aspergillus ellipticus CBS 707.79]|uniref:Uncharacterized protein n=1 Tax=Aspergillus ellipticus CBS 707.79 TaxID=1448320 RepID=A0A319DBP5_9EURO|nr:hypothetical protein BO71DRAFT_401164 [Aspergillus ellipticus CBS 707.79]
MGWSIQHITLLYAVGVASWSRRQLEQTASSSKLDGGGLQAVQLSSARAGEPSGPRIIMAEIRTTPYSVLLLLDPEAGA